MSGQVNPFFVPNTTPAGPVPQPNALAPAPDPYDFSSRYNTALSPAEEQQFQDWAAKAGKLGDVYDYDLRGFWKSGGSFDPTTGHGGDTYKKPNHPTFSDQSQYHGTDGYQGGTWGRGTFTPSAHNLEMMSPPALQRYFTEREPDTRLILPQQQEPR